MRWKMTEQRFIMIQNGNFHTVRDTVEEKPLGMFEFKDNQFPVYACFHNIIDLLNELNDENERLKDALNQRTEQCDKYYEENEQLKKGMIRAVDRYIKNVDCNPPSSTHTYIKIKGALLNIKEDLRDLIGDLDG